MRRSDRALGHLDDPCRAYQYEGIVLNGFEKLDDDLMNLVYVVKTPLDATHFQKTIFGIHKTAFDLNVDSRDLKTNEIPHYRNMKRRLAEPLLFGDYVRWNDQDMDVKNRTIYQFARGTPLHHVLNKKHGYQIQIVGCLNPSKPEFWNQIQPLILSADEARFAEPNVWLSAWVIVHFTGSTVRNARVHFSFLEFVEFELFDIDMQYNVTDAPWNKANIDSEFAYLVVDDKQDEDDDFGIEVEEPVNLKRSKTKWHDHVDDHLGLFVGDRLIISKDLHQYDFIIPVITPLRITNYGEPIYPTPGEYYFFTAQWSFQHLKYFVTKMKAAVEFMPHHVTQLGHLSVRVIVSKEHKGLYQDHESTLGLIDDPDNKLALFKLFPQFHDHRTASVDVRPVRASENKSVRFKIVQRSDDDRMDTYQQWMSRTKFTLKAVLGIVISESFVFAPQYPNVQFRIAEPSQNTNVLGTNLLFDAIHYKGHDFEMIIQNAKMIPEKMKIFKTARRYFKPLTNMKSTLLQVLLKRDPQYQQLVRSEDFGAIDTRDVQLGDMEFKGWIMQSPVIDGTRRASTMFELVSTSDQAPMGVRPPEKSTTDDCSETNSNSSGSSRRSDKISLTSQRFVVRSNPHSSKVSNSGTLLPVSLERNQQYKQQVLSEDFGAIDTPDVQLGDMEFKECIEPSPVINETRQDSKVFKLVTTSNQAPMVVQLPEGSTTDNCSDTNSNSSESSRRSDKTSLTSQTFSQVSLKRNKPCDPLVWSWDYLTKETPEVNLDDFDIEKFVMQPPVVNETGKVSTMCELVTLDEAPMGVQAPGGSTTDGCSNMNDNRSGSSCQSDRNSLTSQRFVVRSNPHSANVFNSEKLLPVSLERDQRNKQQARVGFQSLEGFITDDCSNMNDDRSGRSSQFDRTSITSQRFVDHSNPHSANVSNNEVSDQASRSEAESRES